MHAKNRRGHPASRPGPAAASAALLVALAAGCSSAASSAAGPPASAASPAPGSTQKVSSAPPAGAASPPRSGPSQAKGKAIPGLISFTGTLRLAGARTQHTSFTAFPGVTSPASSCARLATHGTPAAPGHQSGFQIPAPSAGNPVSFTAEVSPYRGPGTYRKASILAAGPSFVVGTATYNPLAATATATVIFRADGSGTFTFRNAVAAKPATGTISGSITWTCSG